VTEKNTGRPTDYCEEFVEMAYVACSEGGFTDKKLAQLFGCNPDTIYEWKKQYKDFSMSIQEGKD
jgi:transposase-like protein